MSLIRLIYASRSLIAAPDRRAEMDRVMISARSLNEQNDITGFLLATPAAFAQVLEGQRQHVAETYGRIVMDPRHTAVNLMLEEPIAARLFPRWSMGMAEYNETTNFIFGLYGVTPESDLPEQPAEALLDLAGELSRQQA